MTREAFIRKWLGHPSCGWKSPEEIPTADEIALIESLLDGNF